MSITDEEMCAQLYRDLCDASMRKDESGMAAVLADDYALVHMTGMRQSKRAYIAAVLDGTLNYYSAEHDSIDVRVASTCRHPRALARERGRVRRRPPHLAFATGPESREAGWRMAPRRVARLDVLEEGL